LRKRKVYLRQSTTIAKRKAGKVLVVTLNKEGKAAEIVYQRVAKYQKPSFSITKTKETDEYIQSSKPKFLYHK